MSGVDKCELISCKDERGFVKVFFFFQAEDGIRDTSVTGVQTCALPISFLTDQILPPANS